MIRKTIALHMYDILTETNNNSVWYGDIDIIHECGKRSGMYKKAGKQDPVSIIQKVLAALDNSSLFEKKYIKHEGRQTRCYFLKSQ